MSARGRGLAILWLVPVALFLDQVTKWIVVQTLTLHSPVPVFGDFLRLTFIHNRGAAFGLTMGGPAVHTVVALGALGVLAWLFHSLPIQARLQRGALAMVLGGALGNIVDRIRLHEVIDFIDVGLSEAWRWPVFNVADSFVTVGVLLLAVTYSRQKEPAEETSPTAADEA
jgi:signal peptidase II